MSSSNHRSKAKTWLGVLLALSLSAVAIAFLLSKLDLTVAQRALASARWEWIAIGAVLTVCITPMRGYRFSLMLGEKLVGVSTAAIGVQTFLNRIAPMRLGELSLPYLMQKYGHVEMARGLVTLVVIRLIELAAVTALLILSLVLRSGESELPMVYVIVALLLLLASLVWFRTLLRLGIRLARSLVGMAGERIEGVVGRFLHRLEQASSTSEKFGWETHSKIVAATTVQIGLQILVFASILEAFGIRVDVVSLVLASSVTFIGTALPVPSVGTVGPLEASWVAGFVMVGLELETAIMTGIATQIATLGYAALIAGPCWVQLRRSARLA